MASSRNESSSGRGRRVLTAQRVLRGPSLNLGERLNRVRQTLDSIAETQNVMRKPDFSAEKHDVEDQGCYVEEIRHNQNLEPSTKSVEELFLNSTVHKYLQSKKALLQMKENKRQSLACPSVQLLKLQVLKAKLEQSLAPLDFKQNLSKVVGSTQTVEKSAEVVEKSAIVIEPSANIPQDGVKTLAVKDSSLVKPKKLVAKIPKRPPKILTEQQNLSLELAGSIKASPVKALLTIYNNLACSYNNKSLRIEPQLELLKSCNSNLELWSCNFHLKWPTKTVFEASGSSPEEASHEAALNVLKWLRSKNKISEFGRPKCLSVALPSEQVEMLGQNSLEDETTRRNNETSADSGIFLDLAPSLARPKLGAENCTRSPIFNGALLHNKRAMCTVASNKNESGPGQLDSHAPAPAISKKNSNKVAEAKNVDLADFEPETMENLRKIFPSPKNILHNAFDNIARQLKDNKYKLHPVYHVAKQTKKTPHMWDCTYNIKWPENLKFTVQGRTKQEASHRAALAVLSWLKDNQKITKEGHPVIVDPAQIKELQQEKVPNLQINGYSMERMGDIIRTYNEDFLPKIVPEASQNGDRKFSLFDEEDEGLGDSEKGDSEMARFLGRPPKFLKYDRYLAKEKVTLPISAYRDEFVKLLKDNQVVIIKGEPGCGKSTRIPQYVLESWVKETYTESNEKINNDNNNNNNDARTKDDLCRIAVTQPRRLAAISLAERVSSERDEQVGHIVGYHVRLRSNFRSQTGRVLYCTTAILLRQCQFDPRLSSFSHVIVDEVHERDANIDLLLNVLRNVCRQNPHIKVVLMSATMDTDLFKGYFEGAPCLNIPGFTYPVKAHYLDEIRQNLDLSKTQSMLSNKNPSVIHEDVFKLINFIHSTKPEGAILCFLPGWGDISKVEKLFSKDPRKNQDKYVLCLHSRLEHAEQSKIFTRAPPGVRKIILATNVAETSVTIDDVVYVVDTGMHNEKRYDVEKGVDCMDVSWISQSSAIQRKGRAGRCQPGESYHLYTKEKFEKFQEFSDPEILRTSLTKIVLDAKVYSNNMPAMDFMSRLPCPPETNAIWRAVTELKDLSLLQENNEDLTPLGRVLSEFPLEPKLSKALMNSVVFECVTPIMDLVTLFSFGSEIFMGGLTDKSLIKRTKQSYSKSSDHLALMRILEKFLEMKSTGRWTEARRFCEQENLVGHRLDTVARLRDQHFEYLEKAIKDSHAISDANSDNDEIVKSVLLSSVGSWLQHRNWDMVNGRLKKTNAFFTNNGQRASVTSESVNFRRTTYPSNYLMYLNETRSNVRRMTLVRETSFISPLSLLLFSHRKLVIKETKTKDEDTAILGLEGLKLEFSCKKDQALRIVKCKDALSSMYDYYIFQITANSKTQPKINRVWSGVLKDLASLLSGNSV